MNKKLLKLSTIGYVGCMPFLTISKVAVTAGMVFGLLMTLFITIEVNKHLDK